jgi:hypothetical protein
MLYLYNTLLKIRNNFLGVPTQAPVIPLVEIRSLTSAWPSPSQGNGALLRQSDPFLQLALVSPEGHDCRKKESI